MGKPGPYATARERVEYLRSVEGGGLSIFDARARVDREDMIDAIERSETIEDMRVLLVKLCRRVDFRRDNDG